MTKYISVKDALANLKAMFQNVDEKVLNEMLEANSKIHFHVLHIDFNMDKAIESLLIINEANPVPKEYANSFLAILLFK
jgi:hypothetical protein